MSTDTSSGRGSGNTPGEWRTTTDDGSSPRLMGQCIVVETDGEHIAFVFNDKPDNARLISAAPTLLTACKAALERIEGMNEATGVIDELRAAIRLAGGVA